MKKHFFIIGFIFIAILLNHSGLHADEDETAGVTMNIPSICKLVITSSDQIIDLSQDASGEAAYEAGYFDGAGNKPGLVVYSNTNWKLSVKVGSDWSIVDTYKKDTADLKLKVTSESGRQTGFLDFSALSLTDQEIATHGGGVGAEIYDCQYRILLDWAEDIPGSYTIILTYTLSTQVF